MKLDNGRFWEYRVARPRATDGRVAFLETGDEMSGLQHIISEHASQFAQKGVTESDLPALIKASTTKGRIVGMKLDRQAPTTSIPEFYPFQGHLSPSWNAGRHNTIAP